MYIGATNGKGLTFLVTRLILNINHYQPNAKLFCHFSILDKNKYQLEILSKGNIHKFLSTLEYDSRTFRTSSRYDGYLAILKTLSDNLDINVISTSKVILDWGMDREVFGDTDMDFSFLAENLMPVAFLNRNIQLLITDNTKEYINQIYHAYPQGLKYLFERHNMEEANYEFHISFDQAVETNHYQIYLAYRTDWYPSPKIESFVDNYHSSCSNDFVEGILEGFISGVRTLVKNFDNQTYKVQKSKFSNGLILFCSVHRDNYQWTEDSKGLYDGEDVKPEIKKIFKALTIDFFNSNNNEAKKFLSRFYNGADVMEKIIGDMYKDKK